MADTKSASDKKEEAANAPTPLKVDGQDQPLTLADVSAQSGTEGAKPDARDKAGKADKKSSRKVTVLHQVIHDGEEHGPGAELSLSHSQAEALIAAGMVVEAVGKEAEQHLAHADAVRAASVPGVAAPVLSTVPGVEPSNKEVDPRDQFKVKGAK